MAPTTRQMGKRNAPTCSQSDHESDKKPSASSSSESSDDDTSLSSKDPNVVDDTLSKKVKTDIKTALKNTVFDRPDIVDGIYLTASTGFHKLRVTARLVASVCFAKFVRKRVFKKRKKQNTNTSSPIDESLGYPPELILFLCETDEDDQQELDNQKQIKVGTKPYPLLKLLDRNQIVD